jgi:hypothetical protein
VILGVRPSEFILSEFQSPSRRIFIGSHSLPPPLWSPNRSFSKHHSNGETLRRLPNIHHLSSPLGFLHTTTLTHLFSPLLPSAPSQLTRLNPLPPWPAAPPPPRPPSSHRLNLLPLHRRIHGGTQPAGSAPASGRPCAATPRAPPPRPFEPPCPAHSSTG